MSPWTTPILMHNMSDFDFLPYGAGTKVKIEVEE